MRPVADLVVHLGVPHSGARQVARALTALRPQLRDHGVAYVAGRVADRTDDPVRDADRLRQRVQAERRRTASRTGGSQTVLVSDGGLLGPAALPGRHSWYPQGRSLVEPLVAALAPVRTTLLLVTRRQDRWLERQHLEDVLHGSTTELADWLAGLPTPAPDYAELASRLEAVPGVDRLVVLPYETGGTGPAPSVRHVLAAVGSGADVSSDGSTQQPPGRACTRRGLAVARALNAEVETAAERKLVRGFVLDHFPAPPDALDLLEPDQRSALLAACSASNRDLFRRHLPTADPSAYADDAGTGRLAALSPGGGTGPAARVGLGARVFRQWDSVPDRRRRVRARFSLSRPERAEGDRADGADAAGHVGG